MKLPAASPDALLTRLEEELRRLALEYDRFFGGGARRPPADLQWRVEQAFRDLSDRTLNFSQQFRMNQLQQRYASWQTLWRRKLDVQESGCRRPADRWLGVAQAPVAVEATTARVELSGEGAADQASAELLYRAFLRLRERAMTAPPAGSLENFLRFLESKAAALRQQSGAARVEASLSLQDGVLRLNVQPKSNSATED